MIVRNVSQGTIERAAELIGVSIQRMKPAGRHGFSFVIRPLSNKFRRLSPGPFGKRPNGLQRRVNAVCFHGHYELFKQLLAAVPGAVIITRSARYESMQDLREGADEVGAENCSSQAYPVNYADACTCGKTLDYGGALLR